MESSGTMPPAGTPPRARTRPVFSGTSRILLRGRFQPTPRGYHRIPPRPLARAPLLEKGGDGKRKRRPFVLAFRVRLRATNSARFSYFAASPLFSLAEL